jgi:hypothetical protein
MTEEREYSVHLRTPHEKQAEFLNSHAKRIVIRAGRHEGVARQVREEGRIAPLESLFGSFWGWPAQTAKPVVARWILADPAEFSASREGMLAFGSRHVYPLPLDVVVGRLCVVSLGRQCVRL